MRLKTFCVLVLIGLVAGACPVVAQASPITFSFTGLVSPDPLLDPDDPFGGTIGNGTAFSGEYTFDSATPDGDPSGNIGSYTSPAGTLTVDIGGNTFLAADLLNIGVGNDLSASDIYTVFAQNTTGPDPFDISLFLQDLDGTVLSGALLLTNAPPFGAFEVATLFLSGTVAGNQVQIQGILTSLACVRGCVPGGETGAPSPVPEPATLTLLGGVLGVGATCRRLMRRWADR